MENITLIEIIMIAHLTFMMACYLTSVYVLTKAIKNIPKEITEYHQVVIKKKQTEKIDTKSVNPSIITKEKEQTQEVKDTPRKGLKVKIRNEF